MFYMCGLNQHFAGSRLCQNNNQKNGQDTFSLEFSSGFNQKVYSCEDKSTLVSGSYEYLKLEFICRDRTEGVGIFAMFVLILTIGLSITSISMLVYTQRTKVEVPDILTNRRLAAGPMSQLDRVEMAEFAKK